MAISLGDEARRASPASGVSAASEAAGVPVPEERFWNLPNTITVVRTLTKLFTKSGRLGEMLFKVQEIVYTNQLDQVVATQETTTITFGEPDPNSGGTLVGTV